MSCVFADLPACEFEKQVFEVGRPVQAAQAGLEVEAYTVNDAELADALTSLGVVGITTNTLLPAATTAEPMQLQDAEAIVARFAQDFTMTSELEP